MHQHTIRVAVIVALATFAAGATTAEARAQKSVKFSSHCTGKLVSSTELKGKCTSTLGDYSSVTHSSGHSYREVDTYKGGSIDISGSLKLTGTGGTANTWKVTGGTGKFKGASGHGTGTSKLGATTTVTLSGTISY